MTQDNNIETIVFSGAGGVPDMEIKVRRDGGLYVIEGANGVGKSQMLQGLHDLTTGERSMRVKHGRRSGTIEGFGASIHLGGRTTRRGHLEVVGLSGRMDVASIVDPGVKQRDAANRAIVKALVRMAGIEPDLTQFHVLAPGETDEERASEFRRMFPALDSDDLVELARKIKEGFDAQARLAKGEADRVQGEAEALLATGADLDLDQPADEQALQESMEEALAQQAQVRERADLYHRLRREADEARSKMADGGAPSPDEFTRAEESIVAAEETAASSTETLANVRQQLADARAEVQRLEDRERETVAACKMADMGVQSAEQALDALNATARGWEAAQASLDALEGVQLVSDAEVAEASEAVEGAREALQQGVLVRDAIAKRARGKSRRMEAARLAAREQELRDAGRATDGVLSDILNEAGVQGMSVIDGEVYAQLPEDPEPRVYLDMSDGERTRAALLATIPVVQSVVPEGEQGVIVLGQRVYQDLDPEKRAELAEFVRGLGVKVFTALPTDGPLRVVAHEADRPTGEEGTESES